MTLNERTVAGAMGPACSESEAVYCRIWKGETVRLEPECGRGAGCLGWL